LATHPINRFDLPFRTLTRLVDCDRFHDIGIFFPALWTEPDTSACSRAACRSCNACPSSATALDLSFETMDAAELERFAERARNPRRARRLQEALSREG